MRKGYIHFEKLASREQTAFTGAEVVITDTSLLFWKPPAIFSQWTQSEFEIDGVLYACAEQYMMAEKARLFGDDEMLAGILAVQSPRKQKALGQKVRGFSEGLWRERREGIVVRGNLAKFTQDRDRKEELLETGTADLVEASPLDRIWGIGLRADDPRVLNPYQWQGLNLLGKALMKVRGMVGVSGS